jgi:hypothetical protein
MHKLWFKDGKSMPRYLNTLLALLEEYDAKETKILAKHNLAGSVAEYE